MGQKGIILFCLVLLAPLLVSGEITSQNLFEYRKSSYTSSDLTQPNLNQSQFFLLENKSNFESAAWRFYVDFIGQNYSELRSSFLLVPDLYLQKKNQEVGLKVTLGRQQFNWSDLDTTWQLSIWQPAFGLDPLRPVSQGLTGAFFSLAYDWIEAGFFVSSVFAPNQGITIKNTEDGHLHLQNRWVLSPKTEFPLNGRATPIKYALHIPKTEDVIKQPSVAYFASVGLQSQGPRLQFALGQKPANELPLTYKKRLRVRDEGAYGEVDIYPLVIRESVANVDLLYQWNSKVKLVLSSLQERPINQAADEGWNRQIFNSIDAAAARFEFFNFTLARLQIRGGEIVDPLTDGYRIKFRDAWQLGYSGRLFSFFKYACASDVRYVYDLEQQGSYLNLNLKFEFGRNFTVKAGADVLGVHDSGKENLSKAFLNQNRANDRFYSGLEYGF